MLTKRFEELKATGALPSPPGVGMEILRLTQNVDCSVDELARCIQADPSLTGRLLKIANSALAGGARPCTTIQEATMRLGLRSVRNLALGFSLVSAHRNGACEAFDYGVFWSQSLARAVAAHLLSARFKVGVPTEAFVAALVSDLGSLALATVHPREFAAILVAPEAATINGRAVLEQQRFGIDHREVTASMLTDWRLPDVFARAAQKLGAAEAPLEAGARGGPGLCLLTWIAERFAAAFILPQDKPLELDRVQRALGAFPGWKEEDLAGLWNEMAGEWRTWGSMLEIVVTAVPPYDGGAPTRARVGSPLLASAKPGAKPPVAPAATVEPADAGDAGEPVDAGEPIDANDPADANEPVAPSEPAAAPIPPPAAPRVAQRARVLVVIDDPASLRLFTTLLQRAGHHVTTSSDAKEALRSAMTSLPQIVIADRALPSFDGIQLCKSLRAFEAGRRIYFILVTSDENEDRIVEGFDAGCDDYVARPFKPKLLLARVRAGMRVVRLQERIDADKATMLQQVADLGIKERKLQQAAVTDDLTELPNRRYAMEALKGGWEAALRGDEPMSAIMIDIDTFKRVNDTHGHDIGDLVLKETAKVLSGRVEPPASVCRLGGEEFVVVLPGTPGERATELAEMLRDAIAGHAVKGGSFDGGVTISLGVATRRAAVADAEALLKLADESLYRAKKEGRNRVCYMQGDGKPVEPVEPVGTSGSGGD